MLYKNFSQGFVLLGVLIILQISSLVGTTMLANAFLQTRMASERWQREIVLSQINKLNKYLSHQFVKNNARCLVTFPAPQNIQNQPMNWWEQGGCSGNLFEIRYYYAIEFLANDPCAKINNSGGKMAAYYRLTLLSFPRKLKDAKFITQTTLIKATAETSLCEEQEHFVNEGIQTQHHFY